MSSLTSTASKAERPIGEEQVAFAGLDDVDLYSRHTFSCRCGRTHTLPISAVDISPGAADRLPDMVAAHGLGTTGVLLTDEVVFSGIGRDVYDRWAATGLDIQPQILPGRVIPDEETIGRVICRLPDNLDFIATIGGGSITDIGRYVGWRLKVPVVAIPSAMTMDGFFTNMSVVIIGGLQRTLYLDYPAVVLADTTIIAQAPPSMNAAGVGEVAAKISAGLDWYAANQVKDVHHCPVIADLMASCVARGTADATIDGIATGDSAALANLTDALYRAAVGMAWYEASLSGSGAEHTLNHYWVMCQENRGVPQSMHGQAVGSGAVVDLMMWDEIMKCDLTALPDGIGDALDHDTWVSGVRNAYGPQAQEILELQTGHHSFDQGDRQSELARVRECADALRARFDDAPSAEHVADKLRRAGTASGPRDLGITRDEFIDSVLYAKEMRTGRFNCLWLAESLGLAEEIAETLATRLGY